MDDEAPTLKWWASAIILIAAAFALLWLWLIWTGAR
jgi:hypothetical protein